MLNSWSQRLLRTRHPTSMKIFKSKSQILSEACNLFSSKCGKKGLVEKREKIDCTKMGKDSKEDKNVIPKTHYDFPPPKFNYYRRDKLKNPKSRNKDSFEERRAFSYTMATAGLVGGLYAAKGLVNTFIKSMSATADVLAMAAIEIKLADIPEGKHVTMKWRGKPLFIWHRTPFLIEAARKVDISTLRDPQEDSERVQRPEWLVLIGVCTHLGCVPIAHSGDFHGYYCPCHGSHFDSAGRARKGPAPRNLEVPPYVFVGETLVVG